MSKAVNRIAEDITNLSAPISVWWDITNKCNLSCLHCYSSSSPDRNNSDELTFNEAKKLISELSDIGVFAIFFLGGEPLMRPDIFDIIKYTRSKSISVTISSNGWLVTKEVAEKLSLLEINQIGISLDGASSKTHDWLRNKEGSFEHAVNAVINLKKSGIPNVATVTTITHHNVQEVGKIIDLAASLGADNIQCLVVEQSGRGKDNYGILGLTKNEASILKATLEIKRKQYEDRLLVFSSDGVLPSPCYESIRSGLIKPDLMGCPVGRTCCNINYNGDIIPCLLVRKPIIGNIRRNSFKEIWDQSPVFLEWRRKRLGHQECLECPLNYACNRECPLSRSQKSVTSETRKTNIKTLEDEWSHANHLTKSETEKGIAPQI